MSAEAMGFVYRYSPFRGATFAVHLAAADSVNDQNHYDFWMSQGSVAAKARVSRQSANAAVEELIEQGFFELLTERKGQANRYRFLFPECPPVYNPRHVSTELTPSKEDVSTETTPPVTSDDTPVSTELTQKPRTKPRDPKGAGSKKLKTQMLLHWQKRPCPHGALHCNRHTSFCDRCGREWRELVA